MHLALQLMHLASSEMTSVAVKAFLKKCDGAQRLRYAKIHMNQTENQWQKI